MSRSGMVMALGLAAALWVIPSAQAAPAHGPSSCPHMAKNAHAAGVDHRHDEMTGMAAETSVHHFEITSGGGVIRLEAADAADESGRDQARGHLQHVAQSFAAGDFAMPMFIHGQTPPGAATMARLKESIRYRYEATDRGGRVTIDTSNREARKAIHEFLRFQIRDHRTQD
jgi:hypothetical protein